MTTIFRILTACICITVCAEAKCAYRTKIVLCQLAKNCKNGGKCEVSHFPHCNINCRCMTGFSGRFCTIARPGRPSNATSSAPINVTSTKRVLETTTRAPRAYNICDYGVHCYHGYCVKSKYPSCVCHDGWVGYNCNTPCEVDCGLYGHCMYLVGRSVCNCRAHNSTHTFSGRNCAIRKRPSKVIGTTPENGAGEKDAKQPGSPCTMTIVAVSVLAGILLAVCALVAVLWARHRRMASEYSRFQDEYIRSRMDLGCDNPLDVYRPKGTA